jgi:ABC-type nitrate/sulfonate/bicarbonate transport system permease component
MRQHYKTESTVSRAEAALGFALAVVIGTGIAYLLISWWSS